MSIIVSNSEQICHSPTNQSKAKMLYSFSKSPRFPKDKENACDQFYEISSSSFNKRSAGLGYGNKYDFTKDFPKTPAPGSYERQNVFEQSTKKKKGFGFGSGRGQMEVTGIFPRNRNPGPGSYELPSSKSKISYSLKGKLKFDNRERVYVPGPGTYENLSTFNENGKNFLGKFRNKSACKFSNEEKLKIEDLKIPGPGAYDTSKADISPDGHYTLSRMENAKVRKFSKGVRQSFGVRSSTPGPGHYRVPSQFGHYIDRNYAYLAQN